MFVAALDRPRRAVASNASADSSARDKVGAAPAGFLDARFSTTLPTPPMAVRAPWAAYMAGV